MKRNSIHPKKGAEAKEHSLGDAPSRSTADHVANTATALKTPPKRLFHVWFARLAATISKSAGSPITFCVGLAFVLVWAASGPLLHYSAGWQMIINAGTGISTFLMVFIIQNSQTREDMALHIKLDEIIRALQGANNKIINLQTLSHEELENMQNQFAKIGSTARRE